jgi:hypothetical protein
MPWDLIILAASLFAFIFSMIGMLKSYFAKPRKWFLLLLACVLVSGFCVSVELDRLLTSSNGSLPGLGQPPVSPL